MKKAISKEELKSRKLEANTKKNKKRDWRKFANQMFKNPTDHLPLMSHGLGEGTSAYCYHCGITATKVVIKEDKTVVCKDCGYTDVEFRTKKASIIDKLIWRYKEFIYARQHKK